MNKKKKKKVKYITIKRGKVKVEPGSKQHKLLMVRKLPHTVVYTDGTRKRVFAKKKVNK